jgi:GNAT superfamily N-acetyltransferase
VARRRLGVALLVPPPYDTAIDALRLAVGDGALGRVPAHVTLVPPVNVREDALGEALARAREAAASAAARLTLVLGPPTTFLPDNPVLYLPVVGDVEPLRHKAFRAPLWREPAWPYVPHVTLADDLPPERIAGALAALERYSVAIDVSAVHLLQEGPDRAWRPIAGVRLGPPAVIGRGGLAVELTDEVMADPTVAALDLPSGDRWVVARRDGELAGVAVMAKRWLQAVFVVPAFRGEGIGAHLLARAVAPHRRALVDWDDPSARAFLERHGFRPAGHLLARETGS